jgi:hypothetical protein
MENNYELKNIYSGRNGKTNYKQKKINFGLPKVDHGYMIMMR